MDTTDEIEEKRHEGEIGVTAERFDFQTDRNRLDIQARLLSALLE